MSKLATNPRNPAISPQQESIRKDLNRGAAISLAGNVIKVAEFLLTLLAARLFGAHVWGQYVFLNAFFLPVQRLACAGMDKGLVWYLSKHGDSRPPVGFFTKVGARALIFSVPLLIAFGGYRLWMSTGNVSGLTEPKSLLLMALSLPFLLLTNLNLGISLAAKKMEHEVLVRGVVQPILYLALPCAFAVLSRETWVLALFFLVGSIGGYGVSQWLAAPLRKAWDQKPESDSADAAFNTLWDYSWPMGLRDALLALQSRADIWCLALFLPPSGIGIYGLALSIANSIKTVRQSFDTILLAVVSPLHRRADSHHIRDAYVHAGQATVALQAPIFAFLLFFAAPMLALSGSEFTAGEPALLVFAFTLILAGYLGLSAPVVMGMGKTRWGIFNDLLSFSLAVGFNFLFIPRFGITGAALGTSVSILLTNGVWFAEAAYLIRQIPFHPMVLVNFGVGTAMTALPYWIWMKSGDAGTISRAIGFSAFVTAYGIFLYAFRKRIFSGKPRGA